MNKEIYGVACIRKTACASLLLLMGFLPSGANAGLAITPIFESSITSNPNAAQIESSINAALGAFAGLYSPNNVALSVDFSFNAAGAGNLLSTSQYFYAYSYSAYTNALKADALSNPGNTSLATAVAHLNIGNDASGSRAMAITYGQALLLANYGLSTPGFAGNASININSLQPWAFAGNATGAQFDLIGGLEHELDEVLGGGGGGSVLGDSGFFSNKYGALDLYRYAAPGTPSYTVGAASYLSLDGGVTPLVAFNAIAGGDYGDFAPPCNANASGQLIQNAFNCTGAYEPYTVNSPEFAMLQALGWDSNAMAVPEPGSYLLFGCALFGLVWTRRRETLRA